MLSLSTHINTVNTLIKENHHARHVEKYPCSLWAGLYPDPSHFTSRQSKNQQVANTPSVRHFLPLLHNLVQPLGINNASRHLRARSSTRHLALIGTIATAVRGSRLRLAHEPGGRLVASVASSALRRHLSLWPIAWRRVHALRRHLRLRGPATWWWVLECAWGSGCERVSDGQEADDRE